ncbi:aminotransferase class V-fold PLP-dependent enzyme [Xinfangfangia sp. CPCC 101601]|uniref:Aminotransferase class V-fold PLP-dependent enzyme n=1 Tax=Pseudogemmobacter lacusdianii TaxID=3069608 RepID=A0ABU0VVT5_9RHOB|nr:aminotransferase class V-fold PLP-dependent enzyme [Xinfangfangia sp. CPCC 101601]MDQ2065859.1 aminotransferase class V-fold PLP-dependent enzyme [Xinfangfangia sp. CPCC 101601]
MPGLHAHIDPEGLEEFSVVFTDRSLNHMSAKFQGVMRDVSALVKEVYNGSAVALVPGGGTYAMESVARQFGRGKALVIRNGFFSFRWSQIFDMGGFAQSVEVVMARANGNSATSAFAPPPIDEVVAKIHELKPDAVFAPHVETASGIILPDDYIKAVGQAARDVGALFVLDCIASGTIWVDMAANNVDVLISAPQKGWSASPAAGIVVMGPRAEERLAASESNSFAVDLKKWRAIMAAFEGGGHAYHATMPTDAILGMRDAMFETKAMGFEAAKAAQWDLGRKVRALLEARGVKSVAAEGFQAPGVVVSYTEDPAVQNGAKFREKGVQIAAGVPLQVGEGAEFRTFRLGLFGLDKLKDVDGTVARLERAVEGVL